MICLEKLEEADRLLQKVRLKPNFKYISKSLFWNYVIYK